LSRNHSFDEPASPQADPHNPSQTTPSPSSSPIPSTTHSSDRDINSEEASIQALHRSIALHLAHTTTQPTSPASTPNLDNPQIPASPSPSPTPATQLADSGPDHALPPESHIPPPLAAPLNAAAEFLLGLQHEQLVLGAQSHALEAQITQLKSKVFKLEATDYAKFNACEELRRLTEALCLELFLAEYALRDVLAEESGERGFEVAGEVERVMGRVGEVVGRYDRRVGRVRRGIRRC
tara:strand:+ start:14400 stop:15110 length:711 start_codon:yes stop_codon:yes gene_type:complete